MIEAIIGAVAAVQAHMEYDYFRDQYMQQPVAGRQVPSHLQVALNQFKAVSWDTDKHVDVPALIPPPQTTGNAMLDALMTNLHEDGNGTA